MLNLLLSKLKESILSILPVSLIVLILSFTPAVNITGVETLVFCLCAVNLIIGMAMFNLGADLAMTPMGTQVGTGLTKSKKVWLLILVSLIMGILITVAEPDLSVLAEQCGSVIDGTALIICVGVGVGLFLVIGVLKIVFHVNLSLLLMFFYLALFALCAILAENGKYAFIPLSFDSGGVTTGPITVPFIMALGVGIANTIGGRGASENSFGLIALCSVGPMVAVMALSLTAGGELTYQLPEYSIGAGIGKNFLPLVGENLLDVLKALGLIILFFLILQFTVLKLPRQKLLQIGIGILFTFFGLTVFLCSVTIGFMPIGFKIGQQLAGTNKVLLAVMGFVLGMVVVLAEPAVHVLNKQVEEVTGGGVKKTEMLIALSIAVGISICLSIIRMIYKFSILYYLIPGYLISLGLSFFVPKIYTAIAFDSGGVASGPLTSGFILPMAVGACAVLNGEASVLSFGFGVVSIVAMTPLITIQILGFKSIASRKMRHSLTMRRILSADDEQIIYFK